MITGERVCGRALLLIIGIAKHNFIAQMLEMALTLKMIDGCRKTVGKKLVRMALVFLGSE
jgi:hypothetical protein